MKKFIISRKKWLRGDKTEDGSYLKHPDKNLFCCLGLIATQCGVPTKELAGQRTPAQLESDKREKVKFLINLPQNSDYKWVEDAMDINDDENITEEQREKKLYSLFKKHKIELEFTD